MLFAFAYSVLRLLLDIIDVRLRVRDPEAELLLLHADSDGIRAPVPIESGHLFRRIRAPLEGGLRVAPA